MSTEVTQQNVDALYERLCREAEESGYHLNPDVEFTKSLLEGLLINEGRYGYPACPCRLADGEKAKDLDIICPCDYRDDDLTEFGACYCALYVSEEIWKGEQAASAIPDRRPAEGEAHQHEMIPVQIGNLPFPIWRCNVCGYLCARNAPPAVCPICKAKKDRFEKFL